MPEFNPAELDAIVGAVVARLRGQVPGTGPIPVPIPGGGDPDLEQPPVFGPRPSPLPELFPIRTLGIAGVELTQSIQHHGAVGASYGADNSVPLVALKTLVVRVYPFLQRGFSLAGTSATEWVTGELVLSRNNQVIYRSGPTRAAGARVGRQADLDRSLWDREVNGVVPGSSGWDVDILQRNPSLNFNVPAWHCRRGRYEVAVRIWSVRHGPNGGLRASDFRTAEFLNVEAPRLALVRVNWDDGTGTVISPSDADMLGTIRLAERMLPFPYFETTILGVEVDDSGDFSTPVDGGGCNQEWLDLLSTLNWTRLWTMLFQLGDLVYGMVPQAAIPPGTTEVNSGCRTESGAGFAGEAFGLTFAHEIGHYYDRRHVAVSGDPDNDPSYPKYAGSLRSIGEVGIDTGTSPPTVYDPSTSDDIMSYGNNQWISPYTYRGLLDARFDHQSAPTSVRRVRPLLILDLRLHRTADGLTRLEVRKAALVDAPGAATFHRPASAVSPLSVDLLDAEDQVVATHHCRYVRPQGGGCGCHGDGERVSYEREPYIDMQEVIEWPSDVASIAFHRGREPIAVVHVGEAPTVEIGEVERREDDRIHVHVRAEHPRESPTIAVLFSGDDGETWLPVAFNPAEGEVSVSVDRLPGGESCRFRALATAELRSATADTDPFELPRTGRRMYLMMRSSPCEVESGPVALHVLIDTRGLGAVSPTEVRWQSSIQGEVGVGYEVLAELERGEHEITVSAPDGIGGVVSERAIIVVGGRPQHRIG